MGRNLPSLVEWLCMLSRPATFRARALVLALACATMVLTVQLSPAAVIRPTQAFGVTHPTVVESFRTYDATGARIPDTSWRVVGGSGNCCENYLATSAAGRLLDLGGGRLEFSDDRGQSWKYVPFGMAPVIGAEGAVVPAPNGDIVGMTWDPYSGDRVISLKFDAEQATWSYSEFQLHTPFFDRPWMAVLPGPWTVGTATVPYISLMIGGLRKTTTYMSFDGISYTLVGERLGARLVGEGVPLAPGPDPMIDAIQPHTESGLAPLPGGGGLARTGLQCAWWTMRAVPAWRCHQTPAEGWVGRILADSRGYLHRMNLSGGFLEYGVSTDSGETWEVLTMSLPAGAQDEDFDFKTRGDRTVLGVHAHLPTGTDQDFLLTFSTAGGVPALQRTVFIGRGDMNFDSGFGGSRRFDFTNVVMFPDGKIAMSFVDSKHRVSSVAIEM